MTDESKPVEPPDPTPPAGTPSASGEAPAPAESQAASTPESPSGPGAVQQGSLLLGRIAVERGYITKEQLQECLQEQARESGGGRPPRSLGILLVEKGFLSDTKLVTILDEQKARFQQPSQVPTARHEDALFGKLIAQNNLASPQQINECLRLQAEAEERGEPAPRLGELLVQKGYVSQAAVAKLLAVQQKAILACPRCNVKYNVSGYQEGKEYRCKKCGGTIVPPKALDSVHVEESVHDVPPVLAEDVPPEVSAAAKNPNAHFGKYILIKELGRGGMGVVYKAWQNDLRRMVALKMLSTRGSTSAGPQPAVTDEEVKRFYREAQTAAKLKHAHIVSIYEVGQFQNHYYLSMEYVDGMTLDRWIKAGKLHHGPDTESGRRSSRAGHSFRRAAEIVRDVALAVQSAHEQGIIHRDIKPQNVLMDQQGRPHVTDFGLAKSIHAERKDAATITVSGLILGTPAYMSPEQASGGKKKLDARTDVYSLGGVLYECLCGRPPFTKGSSIDIVMQVLKVDPVPPSEIAKYPVPKDLEIICQRAMEKDPARRYQTAKAMAADLDRWLEGEPILARPQSTIYRLQKKVRNNPVVASALAAAAVALVAGGVIALSGPSQKQLQRQQLEAALRDGKTRLEQKRYAEALVLLQQARDIDPGHPEVLRGIEQCNAAIERERRIRKMQEDEERRRLADAERQRKEMEEKLAKLQQEMEDIRKRREQAKTDEERKALEDEARKKEAEARQLTAAGSGTVPPPPDALPPPPDAPKPAPAASVQAPAVPAPAGAVALPIPLTGDGPKLLAAHRYGELYDAIRRDRTAYGPITDHQVACIRAGQQLWETLHLNKQAFKDRKPRLEFPILKALPNVVEAVIVDFNVAKGNIDLQVRMQDGSLGTISQAIPDLGIGDLINLAKVVTRDDDANALVRFGNLYALQGDADNALACLLRAQQLGAAAEWDIAHVVAAACVPPKTAAETKPQKEKLENLLEKYGRVLADAPRNRITEALVALRARVAAAEAETLLAQARDAAQKRQFREAQALVQKILSDYPATPAAADAKAFLMTIPHPDGRLVNGFDSAEDLKALAKSPNAEYEQVTDPALVKEGAGALRLRLATRPVVPPRPAPPNVPASREGSIAGFKLDAADFTRVKAVNFWARATGDQTGQVLFGCYSLFPRDYYFAEFRVDRTWRQIRLPLRSFVAEGTPNWKAVTLLSFTWFGTGMIEFVVDSVRLEE